MAALDPVDVLTKLWGDAGFDDVRVVEVESDPINNYYIAHKGL